MGRPTIALAMLDGFADHAFNAGHWKRLEAAGELLDRVPLTDLDDERAAAVLANTDILVGHWGCPTLTQDVVDGAPGYDCSPMPRAPSSGR